MDRKSRPEPAFTFDRTAFRIQSYEDSDRTTEYWLSRPVLERFAAAWWLTCHAWGLDPEEEHKLDRTVFSMRKQG